MNFHETKKLYDDYVLDTYARYPVAFVRGDGVRLYDSEDREYIDFASGIGVSSIGHGNAMWTDAVAKQARRLAHVSNLYYTEPGGLLAKRLCEISGLAGVFFSNSGAEANEGMIKAARKYSLVKYGTGRHTIVTLLDSFHGRTITTLAATGQDVFHKNFHPFTEGFRHVPRNDIDALKAQPDDICAVMIEAVQGEGGVWELDHEYMRDVRELCAERDWLLLVDEVQTGIGRTGQWFAFQNAEIMPDAVSFAKGIAGGLPLAGFITGKKIRDVFVPGDHATTYGGNPVCCAAALAVLEVLEPEIPEIAKKGAYIRKKIEEANLPVVNGIRGAGLMLGVSVTGAPRDMVQKLLEKGLVCLTAGKDAIRLLPPLTVSYDDCDNAVDIIIDVLNGF